MFCMVLKNSSGNFPSEVQRHNLTLYKFVSVRGKRRERWKTEEEGQRERKGVKGRRGGWRERQRERDRSEQKGNERLDFLNKSKYFIEQWNLYEIKSCTLKDYGSKMRFVVRCQCGLNSYFYECYKIYITRNWTYQIQWIPTYGCKIYWK